MRRGKTRTLGVMATPSSSRSAAFTAIAFVVSPLVAALGLSVAGSVETGGENFSVLSLLGWTVVFYIYAALATLVLALPSFLLLRRFGVVRWWSALLVGIAIGVVVFAFVLPGGSGPVTSDSRLIWCGSMGALSALVFWVIWRRGHMSAPRTHDA
jgi:hypothetical protein